MVPVLCLASSSRMLLQQVAIWSEPLLVIDLLCSIKMSLLLDRNSWKSYPLSRFKSKRWPAVSLSISYLYQQISGSQSRQIKVESTFTQFRCTSIQYALSQYHSETFQFHVAVEKDDFPAIRELQISNSNSYLQVWKHKKAQGITVSNYQQSNK